MTTIQELQEIVKANSIALKEISKQQELRWEKYLQDRKEREQKREQERKAFEQEMETERRKIDSEHKREMRKLNKKFGDNWGSLVEALVDGDLLRQLKKRGIVIDSTYQNIRKKQDNQVITEYDIVAANGREIVVVEVKTTLTVEDIHEFIPKLEQFKSNLPRFKDNIMYGAVAFLKSTPFAIKYAQKKKLFVVQAINSSVTILNEKNFVPRTF